MKTLAASTVLFCFFALMLLPCVSDGQTIAISSLSGSGFCSGDSVSVTFTVTGLWGHRNAFTLQLSDPTGSFSSNFQNLGSIVDTLPGTFSINAIISGSGSHYRIRILGAIPYITSADNGSDIAIESKWWPAAQFYDNSYVNDGSVGIPLTFSVVDEQDPFKDTINYSYSVFWDFGSGATPANATFDINSKSQNSSSSRVTYSSSGHKTTTLSLVGSRCSSIQTYDFNIFDCSAPVIPTDAIVIDSDGTVAESRKTYWVNPGFTLNFADEDTIFAEPGSTISGYSGSKCVMYLKQGSVLNSPKGSNSLIFGDGVSINSDPRFNFTLNCPTLDFDYSNAPPNSIIPASKVDVDALAKTISILPNPTSGNISITGIPQNAMSISVLSLLGTVERTIAKPNSSDLQLDLGTLPHGVYYIRFAMPGAVVTKKIVKE